MEDLTAKLEKLRSEADDCELIGRLATDLGKRALFSKLALRLRALARESRHWEPGLGVRQSTFKSKERFRWRPAAESFVWERGGSEVKHGPPS